MRQTLAAFVLLFALAVSCPAQQLTPEQARARDEAMTLLLRSHELTAAGKTDEAVAAAEAALASAEKSLGAGHELVALALDMLGTLHLNREDYARAENFYSRALAAREKSQGPDHPDVAATLASLGSVYNNLEEYDRAEAALLRALRIREKALGPDKPEVAAALYVLAATYSRRGQYARAEPLLYRALSIQEKLTAPEAPFFLGLTLNNLGFLHLQKGEYDKAEALYLRALAITERLLGPEHRLVATQLNNLAVLYRDRGDYLRAEPLLTRALSIQEKAAGPEHLDTSIALTTLAMLYSDRGDDERALPLFERALRIREKAEGPESTALASALGNVANVYSRRGDHPAAIRLFERALSIIEKKLGADSPLYATMLNNAAVAYSDLGDTARAERLSERALEIKERVLGPSHPDVAVALSNLAYFYFLRNEFDREESLYLRALAITEKAYGPDHPTAGTYLANLSTVYWGRGDTRRALDTLTRGAELRERNLSLVLGVGSEEQKRLYLATLQNEAHEVISFHLGHAPRDPAAAELALTTILRRKGRVLDAVADQTAALRRRLDARDRELLDELSAARSSLARLVLKGADDGATTAAGEARRAEESRLKAEIDRLESEVSSRSAEFRTQARPVTLDAVREAIPAGSALVEFVLYKPFDVKAQGLASRFGPARYAAYVLRREGGPRFVDLGAAEALDAAVLAWRRTLSEPSNAEAASRGRELDEKLMRPVRALVGDARRLFLSPDGALNLIPFGALVGERGRYLVEDYSITYLTSGRDLLRLGAAAAPRQAPLVIANPLFEYPTAAPSSSTTPAAQSRRSADLAGARFNPLPGTKGEAAALGSILPGARVLTEAQASEAEVKRASGPEILHVATHGFFLPDQTRADSDAAAARGLLLGTTQAAQRAGGENPLLRSGLALAGANRGDGGAGEDGVLTALEAAGLDLWGTRLVVLSACETGIGEVKNGEGVYGLRRALVLAGSESQVMSLWQVDDAATRDLMVAYYRRLRAGEGRTEALRQVQLQMLRTARKTEAGRKRSLSSASASSSDRSHPFYWAAFIQSGDWRPASPVN
ncbi:MAG TPA: CHAT domain-containing tetratricopeptide repeat protein [Pyrinomonadaceae bacterium]|jgi:CHAT domain-containing protein/Tfp pilus assembly protein PilF|nr:CHAT domain-containing tetratricopeptide repeat protein [Pyrinomonadaceae bacterium]